MEAGPRGQRVSPLWRFLSALQSGDPEPQSKPGMTLNLNRSLVWPASFKPLLVLRRIPNHYVLLLWRFLSTLPSGDPEPQSKPGMTLNLNRSLVWVSIHYWCYIEIQTTIGVTKNPKPLLLLLHPVLNHYSIRLQISNDYLLVLLWSS
jgi:hypothetical protein